MVVAGLVATDNFAFNTVPVTYNYGFYGGGTRLALQTGAGPGGGPHVKVFQTSPSLAELGGMFGPGSTGGVFVARGDLNGDGTTGEIVAGGAGVVRLFNFTPSDPPVVSPAGNDITPYPGYFGEVRVAAADLNGDGKAEIVTAPGPGGGPHIRAFNSNGTPFTGQLGSGINAYASTFTGGVYVAAADLDSDGDAEVITGAGPGGGPHVRAFNANGTQVAGQVGHGFYAYEPGFNGGVRVAAGYFNNSGNANIVTGAGPGGGPHVRQFTGAGVPVAGQAGHGFYAYAATFTSGVYVAVGDVDTDEPAEIVTGPGPGGGPHVRVFDADGTQAPGQIGFGFYAYEPGFNGGVRVSAGKI